MGSGCCHRSTGSPSSRTGATTAPTSCGCRSGTTSALPTAPALFVRTGRRRRGWAFPSACCGTRTWPMTSIGQPTSSSWAPGRDTHPNAEPGARRPPVSPVRFASQRLAPTSRLAGRRTTLLGRLASRSPLGGLLGRGPLLGRLASRSPLGGLLGRCPLLGRLACRSPLLGGLARRSPLHGLPSRSPLDGLFGRGALDCLSCGGPLLRGLSGRGPSFCGYCHRCTSLGAWSLNRGEACATPGAEAPRRAHCRTGFTFICAGHHVCEGVIDTTPS